MEPVPLRAGFHWIQALRSHLIMSALVAWRKGLPILGGYGLRRRRLEPLSFDAAEEWHQVMLK